MNKSFFQKTIVVWVGALICCALWGSAFPAIKTGYILFNIDTKDIPSLLLFAGMRFVIAGTLALIIGSITSRKLLLPQKGSFKMIAPLSLLQTVGQYVFFYISLANSTGVRSSILNGLNVFIAIIVASLIFKQEKFTSSKLIGSVIGFAGLVVVCLSTGKFEFSFSLLGDAFMILSSTSNAFSSVMIKKFSQKENPIVLSGYQFIMGGFIMIVIGLVAGGRITTVSPVAVILLIYLGCISAVAYSLWGILLKYNNVSRVTVFGFMNQICGVTFSAIFLKEASSLNIYCLLALALVCVGIILVNRDKNE
ncbi:MAG: DMT family transporter [Lachnospiraceae bacterium]|nr:DMT family transporter [Lachnospiraceae bacterium]MDY6220965.1 DMT family transporter [Candidatus Alectryocaccobium sp.]